MTAAKHTDPIVGMDMHLIQPPPPAPPMMVPIPVAGMVMDPADYQPGACTVYVNGLPRARAGNVCMLSPPHIPIGGMFVKPPLSEAELYQGSSTVTADGEAMSAMGHQVLGCHDIGAPAPVRSWKSSPAKSLMKAGSVVLPIPGGAPVMVGGSPTTAASGNAPEAVELDWLKIEFVNRSGHPFDHGAYELELPDGSLRCGRLPEGGILSFAGLLRGTCRLRHWPRHIARDLPRTHVVRDDEWVAEIAWRYGRADWKRVWDAPENDALRRLRRDPHMLRAGDTVVVPFPEEPPLEVSTGGSHRVQLDEVVWNYRIELGGDPDRLPRTLEYSAVEHRADVANLDVSRREFRSAECMQPGVFELPITPETKTLVLRTSDCVWFVRVGRLDPLPATPAGGSVEAVVQRLVGLGLLSSTGRFRSGDSDCLREAVAAFQSEYMDLDDPTGLVDDATLEALAGFDPDPE